MASSKNIKKKTKVKTGTYKNILQKIAYYKGIVQKTVLSIQKYKTLDIVSASDINSCIDKLQDIYHVLNNIENSVSPKSKNINNIVNRLQDINNEITFIFQKYGTDSINDLISIVFGQNYLNEQNLDINKLDIINKYLHPINYKVLTWGNNGFKNTKKRLARNKIVEDFMIVETANTLDCFDLSRTSNIFQLKVYGIKICFQNASLKKTLIVQCIVDDVLVSCCDDNYINSFLKDIYKVINNDFDPNEFNRFVSSLSLKEILIYDKKELFHKFVGYCNQNKLMKQKTISEIIKEFLNADLYKQRTILIQLLLKNDNPEFQYLSYFLYDLLSNENNGSIDTQEQTLLFDTLPWSIKKFFKNAMKNTIDYTKRISNFESNKIPLEQQICLLKAPNSVKEKAMVKLKEIKAKTEDSGSKARAYLEGLLKIPFGTYKSEKLLSLTDTIGKDFNILVKKIKEYDGEFSIPIQDKYTNNDIIQFTNFIKNNYLNKIKTKSYNTLINNYINNKRDVLVSNVCFINSIFKKHNIKNRICHSGKKSKYMKQEITKCICDYSNNSILFNEFQNNKNNNNINIIENINVDISNINSNWNTISNEMETISNTLDKAVHGHKIAKRQIERIIGQWISGEQTGYCFGFEGPPGIGKCHRRGTPIMLSNGKIKKVENIKVGDKLMGDDSTSRNVLALGRGREKMYEIKPVKGDSYVVNESHILSLKMTKAGKKGDKHQTINGKRYFKDDIVDICIKDYLKLPKYLKECLKGYRVPVKFPEKKVDLDPYVLGYWLGDGTSRSPQITTIEEPVIEYFRYYCNDLGLHLTQGKDSKTTRHSLHYYMSSGKSKKNPMLNMLRKHNVLNNKHIPHIYKCNSKDIQLELLAGIIDSDGSLSHGGYDIIQKNERLLDDIIYVARSLGFAAYKTKCEKSCMYKGEKKTGTYYRTFIHGKGVEYIPVKVERKKTNKRKQIKNVLNTGIKVIPLQEDEYYGFQIDGNSRFVLGDFTVTHNTSLARKGLANCLKDNNGEPRPFSFIAVGGASNGSTIAGHNYTYVGSTWGKIVDILIDKKCMNPIIFIDELDKISRTENGKEIIGILTHLIDTTQNEQFQDKYFSGIDLDLSKALFIFSYNDGSAIDRILLDRIHRIKFKHLSLQDKLTICNTYILPEFYEKFNMKDMNITDDILTYIIQHYTNESGVRKLKEILFEILSEINLQILKNFDKDEQDIIIDINTIKTVYLKNKNESKEKKIHTKSQSGIINGLWANALGMGGIIPIESSFMPSNTFLDLNLTGLQGDVMKESMNVAKTLAWKLTPNTTKTKLLNTFKKSKMQCIHIHCPEGAVPKDGPSAGTAITTCIYSLFNNKKIKNDIAITGEINLQGQVTAIGGLELKILGGIRAGVKTFIFPKENLDDFEKIKNEIQDLTIFNNINFISVSTIKEVLNCVFVE